MAKQKEDYLDWYDFLSYCHEYYDVENESYDWFKYSLEEHYFSKPVTIMVESNMDTNIFSDVISIKHLNSKAYLNHEIFFESADSNEQYIRCNDSQFNILKFRIMRKKGMTGIYENMLIDLNDISLILTALGGNGDLSLHEMTRYKKTIHNCYIHINELYKKETGDYY